MKKYFLTLILAGLSLNAEAKNPTGKAGGAEHSQWEEAWTNDFMDCWKNDSGGATGKALTKAMTAKLSDMGPGKEWCPTGAPEDDTQAKLLVLATFKSLSHAESTWNPDLVDPGGTNEPAIGLLQIGTTDATKKHACTGVTSTSDLKKPHTNICCALKIAANVSKGVTGKGTDSGDHKSLGMFATGTSGILGRFWEPMRPGKKRQTMVQDVNSACKQLQTAGYSGQGPLKPTDFEKASSGIEAADNSLPQTRMPAAR